jgi:hypothetical protein
VKEDGAHIELRVRVAARLAVGFGARLGEPDGVPPLTSSFAGDRDHAVEKNQPRDWYSLRGHRRRESAKRVCHEGDFTRITGSIRYRFGVMTETAMVPGR